MSSRLPVVVATAGAVILCACMPSHRMVTAPPTTTTATPSASDASNQQSQGVAARILSAVVLPAGSHRVAMAPVRVLDRPVQSFGDCGIDVDRFWVVPGTSQTVQAFLLSHPPAGVGNPIGKGQSSGLPFIFFTVEGPGQVDQSQLLFAIAQDQDSVGLRADAQIVPLSGGPNCQTSQ